MRSGAESFLSDRWARAWVEGGVGAGEGGDWLSWPHVSPDLIGSAVSLFCVLLVLTLASKVFLCL